MLNYIIIENDQKYRDIYKSIINEIMNKSSLKYECQEFIEYSDKLNRIINDNSSFKIYLIDICLDSNKCGIDIANEIRKVDFKSEIIFITGQDFLFETVFKSVHKVYAFIYKHYKMEETLRKELEEIISYYARNMKFFILDKKGNNKVAIKDILYIYRETSERKVYVVTKSKKYPTYLNLRDILELYGKYFIQIHRACLINPKQIDMYNWADNYFVLKNGEQIFMCSKKYKDNIV